MKQEVTKLRVLTRDWLLGITDMAALIGTRCYYVWPAVKPTFPFLAYTMSRRPATSYTGFAWSSKLRISIVGEIGAGEIDQVERLIVNDIADDATWPSPLTNASVLCQMCAFVGASEDTPIDFVGESNLYVVQRDLSFDMTFTGL